MRCLTRDESRRYPDAVGDKMSSALPPVGLTYEQYENLQILLYKVLVTPFDKADAKECAANDWSTDCANVGMNEYFAPAYAPVAAAAVGAASPSSAPQQLLGRSQLMDAMFELADVWTRGVTAEEYSAFLRTLLETISDGKTLKSLKEVKHRDVGAVAEARVAMEVASEMSHADHDDEEDRIGVPTTRRTSNRRAAGVPPALERCQERALRQTS